MEHANPIWEIYLITNAISSRQYIGITKRGISLRWRNHIWDARHRRHETSSLHRSIRKHGEKAFTVECLFVGFDRDIGIQAEKSLIADYETRAPHGYNLTPGGDGHEGPHKPFTKSTLEKMRAAKIGRALSKEHKDKIGFAHKDRKQSTEWIERRTSKLRGIKRGGPMPAEVRKKISAANMGHVVSNETRIKIGTANAGRQPNEITRSLMSSARIGKPFRGQTFTKSGLRGAYRSGNTWFSHIKVNGIKTYLGSFPTADDAHAAYCRAAVEAFGDAAKFD